MSVTLSAAVAAFEADLARYEELANDLKAITINSQKNLARATKLLEEAANFEQRLSDDVTKLVEAMQNARDRQQGSAELTLAAAKKIESRMAEHNLLMQKFAALGERARGASDPVQEVMSQAAENVEPGVLAKGLGEVKTRMDEIVAETDAMIREAEAGDWSDIAREAESLKQKVQAARNKIAITQRKVAERAPA
jgi:hypothetical protein